MDYYAKYLKYKKKYLDLKDLQKAGSIRRLAIKRTPI